jgi:uncharacterized protein
MTDNKPQRLDLRDAGTQPITVAGKVFAGDTSGALYWPGEATLIVSDLHLEKGSSRAHRGRLIPPYDTRETLVKLAEAIDRFEPTRVIALGDSFHDVGAADRISADDLAVLHMIQENRTWVWVTGNHDPAIAPRLGGRVVDDITIDSITFRHEPRPGRVTHEVAGHLHPAAKITKLSHTLRRPCFIGNGRRLILPAFGAYTGGLNVLDEAFEPIFGSDGMNVWMMGQDGIYPIATRLLREDT